MEGLQQSKEIQEILMAELWKYQVDLQQTPLSRRENSSVHQQV